MATTVYFRTTFPTFVTNAGDGVILTFRGNNASLTLGADTIGWGNTGGLLGPTVGTGTGTTIDTATVAGPTAGKVVSSTTTPRCWITDPLSADVTISGTVSFRLCGLESNMNANAAFRCAVYRLDHNEILTAIVDATDDAEIGTTLGAMTWNATPTSTACNKGDRLVAFPMIDDAPALTMGSGQTVTLRYNGSNANTADTSITFNETFSFTTSAPAGTSYYLRDTASDVNPGGATEKAMSTSQGSGTATAVHAQVAGPLSFPGDQWTVSSGGADIEWYTPQLNAFTLGGIVQVDIGQSGALMDGTANIGDSIVCELAVTASDGSGATVWARNNIYGTLSGSVQTYPYYLMGDDVSVSQGQRLRLRIYSDDTSSLLNISGTTDRTIRYDGTSSYASRILLSQSVTEYTPAGFSPPPYGARYRPHFTTPMRRYR